MAPGHTSVGLLRMPCRRPWNPPNCMDLPIGNANSHRAQCTRCNLLPLLQLRLAFPFQPRRQLQLTHTSGGLRRMTGSLTRYPPNCMVLPIGNASSHRALCTHCNPLLCLQLRRAFPLQPRRQLQLTHTSVDLLRMTCSLPRYLPNCIYLPIGNASSHRVQCTRCNPLLFLQLQLAFPLQPRWQPQLTHTNVDLLRMTCSLPRYLPNCIYLPIGNASNHRAQCTRRNPSPPLQKLDQWR